jgi:hypothetical protein
MTMRRLICSAGAFALACITLVTVQAQRQGGGGAAAPAPGPGNLITGAWGENPLPLDARGWGWIRSLRARLTTSSAATGSRSCARRFARRKRTESRSVSCAPSAQNAWIGS